jgi:hypothetical protein
MQVLNFDEPFAPAYGIVHMEPNTYVFYRGYLTKYPAISNRPSYFGTSSNALRYSSGSDRTISAFTNTKPLRLLDVRFMKDILRQIFAEDQSNDEIFSVILSFGISSLYNQCLLAQNRYGTDNESVKALVKTYRKGLYEQQGVRIAETTNDSYTMAFLQKLFHGMFDGFVSPVQESPYHIAQSGKIPAEMIIFNPIVSGIQVLPESAYIPYTVTMNYLYGREFIRKIHTEKSNFYMKGGDQKDDNPGIIPSVEKITEEFHTNPTIRKEWRQGAAAGERWRKRIDFTVLDKTLVHVTPSRNKTRRQRRGSNRVSSVEGMSEEIQSVQTQNPDIIRFDPPITLREYEQMVRAENALKNTHAMAPTFKVNPWSS